MRKPKPTKTLTIPERELCQMMGCSRILTAKWIGMKGNRKMVVYGEV